MRSLCWHVQFASPQFFAAAARKQVRYLFFDRSRGNEGADYGCAAADPPRTHEFFQIFLETRIRIPDAFRILNNRLAIGEQSGHRESHRYPMISEAREFSAA